MLAPLASLVVSVAALLLAEPRGDLAAEIDALVAPKVAPNPGTGAPGVAVLLMKEGKVLHSKGYGLADVEKKTPIDSATTFDLASCSKAFTAYALLILEQEGALELEDDVRKFVPELPAFDPKSGAGRAIRLVDLLHHVTGLPDYTEMKLPKPEEEVTELDLVKLVATRPLDFPTGTKWDYSNTNYMVAGLVIERASGERYAEFVGSRILEPLGMSHTSIFDAPRKEIPRGATGYGRRSAPGGRPTDVLALRPVHSDLATIGDGGIWSSLDDLAKWDAEMRMPTLVSAKRFERAFTSGRLDDGSATGYALGWGVNVADRGFGEPVAEHAGAWVGFLCAHLRLRKSGVTVVVLTNREDGAIRPMELARRIVEIYRKETGGA
jgi:CubicO group peptidase (beta-lactamase class C family)